MYRRINADIGLLLPTISQAHVNDYDALIAGVGHYGTANYQRDYRHYWRMNAARLCVPFYSAYFNQIGVALARPAGIHLGALANTLYAVPSHKNGRQSLQFSFSTKLFHMINNRAPIYDSLVASFYFFQEPDFSLPVATRVNAFVNFHNFLTCEYSRIIQMGLLTPAINQFRAHFHPIHFSDEKVIDSLIWAYVSYLNAGALTTRAISYL